MFSPSGHQEIWNSLVSEPGIGVCVVAEDGLILYANVQTTSMYDQAAPEELIGKRFDELFPEEWVKERLSLIHRVLESGEPMTLRVIWNGRQIRSTYRPIETPEGDSAGKRVLILSRGCPLGGQGAVNPQDVVEAEIVHLGKLDVLTSKEIEVLALLGQGLRLKEIAEVLHRSPKTIDNHRTSIGRKLNLADRVDLAKVAAEAGLELRDAQRKRVAPEQTPFSSE